MENGPNGAHGQHAQELAAMELKLTQEIVQILDPPGEDYLALDSVEKHNSVIQIRVRLVSIFTIKDLSKNQKIRFYHPRVKMT